MPISHRLFNAFFPFLHMSTKPDFSWMGTQSTYDGPSLAEIKEREKKKDNAKCTLYINQLNLATTKHDLRQYLTAAGCRVMDCRVVYKDHTSTGVAYVDVADEDSMQVGLSLHQETFAESKLLVRRHVSREELLNIVRSKKISASENRGQNGIGRKLGNCFQFQRGECSRGDSCKFSHVVSEKDDQGSQDGRVGNKRKPSNFSSAGRDESKRKVCFSFQKGSCNRGDKCKFAHVLEKGSRNGESRAKKARKRMSKSSPGHTAR